MKYEIKLLKSEEGYAVWCPALPGCWSQGASEQEAMENIKDAIVEYMADEEETPLLNAESRMVEVGG
jgi:predicted RNase H-like HicB family nuclease